MKQLRECPECKSKRLILEKIKMDEHMDTFNRMIPKNFGSTIYNHFMMFQRCCNCDWHSRPVMQSTVETPMPLDMYETIMKSN